MYILKFSTKTSSESISSHLDAIEDYSLDSAFADIYQDSDGLWHSDTSDFSQSGKERYYQLSETKYIEFLKKFNPSLLYDKSSMGDGEHAEQLKAEQKALKQIAQAAKTIYSKKQTKTNHAKTTTEQKNEFEQQLIVALRAYDAVTDETNNNPYNIFFDNTDQSGSKINIKDIKEQLQNTDLSIIELLAHLPETQTATPSSKANTLNILGQNTAWIAADASIEAFKPTIISTTLKGTFGAFAIGTAISLSCGILSASIYRHNALNKFKEKYHRDPSEKEEKHINHRAKHFGYKVSGAFFGYSAGMSILQGLFVLTKFAAHHHPVVLLASLLISAAAGVGDAVGLCAACYADKESMIYKNGVLSKKRLSGLFATSFATGFIASFAIRALPKPAIKFLKHSAKGMKPAFKKFSAWIKSAFTKQPALSITGATIGGASLLFSAYLLKKRHKAKQQSKAAKTKKTHYNQLFKLFKKPNRHASFDSGASSRLDDAIHQDKKFNKKFR